MACGSKFRAEDSHINKVMLAISIVNETNHKPPPSLPAAWRGACSRCGTSLFPAPARGVCPAAPWTERPPPPPPGSLPAPSDSPATPARHNNHMEGQTGTIITWNGQTGTIITLNGQPGTIITWNGQTGKIITWNGQTGTIITWNGQPGTIITWNGQTGKIITWNGQTGTIITWNGQSGTIHT